MVSRKERRGKRRSNNKITRTERRKIKKNKRLKVTLFSILGVFLALITTLTLYVLSFTRKIDRVKLNKTDIGITEEIKEKIQEYPSSEEIINIALFGVDAGDNEAGRSDSIMILSIDPINNKIKLSSLMRDSYVYIPGYGLDKLNHAFAFGNSELALKTINQNFQLNIDNFVSANFSSLPKIIDNIGGIEVNITAEEINHIPNIKEPGIHLLTGEQALAYSRIRYAEGGDYQRTSRHRTVLASIYNKVKLTPIEEFPKLLNELLPLVQTNMGTSQLLKIGTTISKINSSGIIEDRFPRDGYCQGETIDGIYYLTFNTSETVNQIHKFIFE